ncbi:matrix metalloproteinase-28 isoform X2 [Nerophis ophidion]|uniref:matrix metalloproteinase-28 isoform X2 n=1 Tax=Nerophis ophidion TaxID=159077 RepID=UPI002ADF5CBE|nr:matrix metalloproteinase-28 isoform X2 [Nerophis ophidion]
MNHYQGGHGGKPAWILLAATCLLSANTARGSLLLTPQVFLEKYGYLHDNNHFHNAAEMQSAIRDFQWLSRLPMTGELDSATLRQMAEPRCGVSDQVSQQIWAKRVNIKRTARSATLGPQWRRRKRFAVKADKWYKHHLAYHIVNWPSHLSPGSVRLAVNAAFQLWSNVSGLVFREAPEGAADIRLAFYEGDHNDGASNAFDGPGKPAGDRAVRLPGEVLHAALQEWESTDVLNRQNNGRPLYCQSGLFDAVTADQNGTTVVFRGGVYWTISADGDVSGPLPLRRTWTDLPMAIEAAAFSPPDAKWFFFKGRQVWRYSGRVLDAGFPKHVMESGLPRRPDCAFYYAPLGHMVLFKGARYFVLNLQTLRQEPYYPRRLKDWTGVPRGTNGVLSRPDGRLYMFRGQQYWTFDPHKVRVTRVGQWAKELSWMGCGQLPGSNTIL